LIVAGILAGWIIAPLAANMSLDTYFSDPHAVLYPFSSLFMFSAAHIHAAFPGSPFPDEINSPLWTVKYELFAYAAFGIISVLGLLRSRFTVVATAVLLGEMPCFCRRTFDGCGARRLRHGDGQEPRLWGRSGVR
jgi:peptidoglycan/LPS O-acetylase OafA/YrhL